jgi:hypothetical protein
MKIQWSTVVTFVIAFVIAELVSSMVLPAITGALGKGDGFDDED